jgi:hypothetical protein
MSESKRSRRHFTTEQKVAILKRSNTSFTAWATS